MRIFLFFNSFLEPSTNKPFGGKDTYFQKRPTAGPLGTPDTNILRLGSIIQSQEFEKAVNRLKKHLKSKSRSYQSKFQKQEEIKSKKRDGIHFLKFKIKSQRAAAASPPPPFVFEFWWKKLYRLFSCFLFLLVVGLCFDNFLICFSGAFSIYRESPE